MKDDLISRSAAKDEILSWAAVINKPHLLSKDDTLHVLDTLPAVDAEEVFKSLPYVKEALEMAKQTVAPVIRCKDCYYWMKAKVNRNGGLVCPKSGMEITATDYCSRAEKRKCHYDR